MPELDHLYNSITPAHYFEFACSRGRMHSLVLYSSILFGPTSGVAPWPAGGGTAASQKSSVPAQAWVGYGAPVSHQGNFQLEGS